MNEKEEHADELIIANKQLIFQNEEKEKRAAELVIANKELAFQNEEKEKRAAELIIANKELTFQNEEKEKRAAELVIANIELAYQNEEKEKLAAELVIANKELESFAFISSHDLQEPLRKIQFFSSRILSSEYQNLSATGKSYFERMQYTALRMQTLINDLLDYSRTKTTDRKLEIRDLNKLVADVKAELKEELLQKKATIEANELCEVNVIPFQFHQLLKNLIDNSLKFSKPGQPPHIVIKSTFIKGNKSNAGLLSAGKEYCHISVSDNGIGFDPQYKDRIFEIFKRLNENEQYTGTGMGLSIVKKIVENHKGIITATGKLNTGAAFDIYIPTKE